MSQPITLTEQENRFLQELFIETYQNDQVRSLEGPLILSITTKLETWPTALILTEQENRRIQVFMESSYELAAPYPYPYYPQTFGQDTTQVGLIKSILSKLEAAQ